MRSVKSSLSSENKREVPRIPQPPTTAATTTATGKRVSERFDYDHHLIPLSSQRRSLLNTFLSGVNGAKLRTLLVPITLLYLHKRRRSREQRGAQLHQFAVAQSPPRDSSPPVTSSPSHSVPPPSPSTSSSSSLCAFHLFAQRAARDSPFMAGMAHAPLRDLLVTAKEKYRFVALAGDVLCFVGEEHFRQGVLLCLSGTVSFKYVGYHNGVAAHSPITLDVSPTALAHAEQCAAPLSTQHGRRQLAKMGMQSALLGACSQRGSLVGINTTIEGPFVFGCSNAIAHAASTVHVSCVTDCDVLYFPHRLWLEAFFSPLNPPLLPSTRRALLSHRLAVLSDMYPLSDLLLAQSWVLNCLSSQPALLERVRQRLAPMCFVPGERIAARGAVAKGIYFIRRGRVSMPTTGCGARRGDHHGTIDDELGTNLGDGEDDDDDADASRALFLTRESMAKTDANALVIIGERSIAFEEPLRVGVVAQTLCDVWFLPKADYAHQGVVPKRERDAIVAKGVAMRVEALLEWKATRKGEAALEELFAAALRGNGNGGEAKEAVKDNSSDYLPPPYLKGCPDHLFAVLAALSFPRVLPAYTAVGSQSDWNDFVIIIVKGTASAQHVSSRQRLNGESNVTKDVEDELTDGDGNGAATESYSFPRRYTTRTSGGTVSSEFSMPTRFSKGSCVGLSAVVRHRWPFSVCTNTTLIAWYVPRADYMNVLAHFNVLEAAIAFETRCLIYAQVQHRLQILTPSSAGLAAGTVAATAKPRPIQPILAALALREAPQHTFSHDVKGKVPGGDGGGKGGEAAADKAPVAAAAEKEEEVGDGDDEGRRAMRAARRRSSVAKTLLLSDQKEKSERRQLDVNAAGSGRAVSNSTQPPPPLIPPLRKANRLEKEKETALLFHPAEPSVSYGRITHLDALRAVCQVAVHREAFVLFSRFPLVTTDIVDHHQSMLGIQSFPSSLSAAPAATTTRERLESLRGVLGNDYRRGGVGGGGDDDEEKDSQHDLRDLEYSDENHDENRDVDEAKKVLGAPSHPIAQPHSTATTTEGVAEKTARTVNSKTHSPKVVGVGFKDYPGHHPSTVPKRMPSSFALRTPSRTKASKQPHTKRTTALSSTGHCDEKRREDGGGAVNISTNAHLGDPLIGSERGALNDNRGIRGEAEEASLRQPIQPTPKVVVSGVPRRPKPPPAALPTLPQGVLSFFTESDSDDSESASSASSSFSSGENPKTRNAKQNVDSALDPLKPLPYRPINPHTYAPILPEVATRGLVVAIATTTTAARPRRCGGGEIASPPSSPSMRARRGGDADDGSSGSAGRERRRRRSRQRSVASATESTTSTTADVVGDILRLNGGAGGGGGGGSWKRSVSFVMSQAETASGMSLDATLSSPSTSFLVRGASSLRSVPSPNKSETKMANARRRSSGDYGDDVAIDDDGLDGPVWDALTKGEGGEEAEGNFGSSSFSSCRTLLNSRRQQNGSNRGFGGGGEGRRWLLPSSSQTITPFEAKMQKQQSLRFAREEIARRIAALERCEAKNARAIETFEASLRMNMTTTTHSSTAMPRRQVTKESAGHDHHDDGDDSNKPIRSSNNADGKETDLVIRTNSAPNTKKKHEKEVSADGPNAEKEDGFGFQMLLYLKRIGKTTQQPLPAAGEKEVGLQGDALAVEAPADSVSPAAVIAPYHGGAVELPSADSSKGEGQEGRSAVTPPSRPLSAQTAMGSQNKTALSNNKSRSMCRGTQSALVTPTPPTMTARGERDCAPPPPPITVKPPRRPYTSSIMLGRRPRVVALSHRQEDDPPLQHAQ